MRPDAKVAPNECVVGVYDSASQAESAVRALGQAGLRHDRVSVVRRHIDPAGKTAAPWHEPPGARPGDHRREACSRPWPGSAKSIRRESGLLVNVLVARRRPNGRRRLFNRCAEEN
jgi:hypothetical protein